MFVTQTALSLEDEREKCEDLAKAMKRPINLFK